MDKAFGAQGKIQNFPFKDLSEIVHGSDGVLIKVKEGIMYVEAESENLLNEEIQNAHLFLALWTQRQDSKVTADFSHQWKLNSKGGKDIALEMTDTVTMRDRFQATITHVVSTQGRARIITQKMQDSASFIHDTPLFQKTKKHPVLKQVILHFSEEVVDAKRPLYGVYKALEAITKHLGEKGREKLADLAGKEKKFVGEIMGAAQRERHHDPDDFIGLDEDECKKRAKYLIDVFSTSLE